MKTYALPSDVLAVRIPLGLADHFDRYMALEKLTACSETSSNTEVATCTLDHETRELVINPLAIGETTITVTAATGSATGSDTIILQVQDPQIKEVLIDVDKAILVYPTPAPTPAPAAASSASPEDTPEPAPAPVQQAA